MTLRHGRPRKEGAVCLPKNIQIFMQGCGLHAQLLRGGVGSMLVKGANLVLGLILTLILARALGSEGYGIYTYALTLVSLLAILAQSGIPTLAIREVAAYQSVGQWGYLRGFLVRANQYILVFALLIGFVTGSIVWFLAEGIEAMQLATLALGLMLLPFITLVNLFGATLQGLRKVVLGQLPESVLRPGLFLLLIVMLLIQRESGVVTPTDAMVLHVIAAGLVFVVGSVLLWRHLPTQARGVLARHETRRWFASALPLTLISAMYLINSQSDILMLGVFRTSEEVGVYRVAVLGSTLVAFTLVAIQSAVAPYISRLYTQGSMQQLQRMVTFSAWLILLGALPVAALLIAFGEPILRLTFGADYGSGHIALAILCMAQLINAGMGLVDHLLVMTGDERIVSIGLSIAATSNVLLNLMLIPMFGMEGAALSTLVTFMVWKVVLVYQVHRRLGIISTVRFASDSRNAGMP